MLRSEGAAVSSGPRHVALTGGAGMPCNTVRLMSYVMPQDIPFGSRRSRLRTGRTRTCLKPTAGLRGPSGPAGLRSPAPSKEGSLWRRELKHPPRQNPLKGYRQGQRRNRLGPVLLEPSTARHGPHGRRAPEAMTTSVISPEHRPSPYPRRLMNAAPWEKARALWVKWRVRRLLF